jgi:hypothetical protein
MNAIVLDPISITSLSSTSGSKFSLNADKSVGWKSEAQRLAWGANRRAQPAAISVERNAQVSTKSGIDLQRVAGSDSAIDHSLVFNTEGGNGSSALIRERIIFCPKRAGE